MPESVDRSVAHELESPGERNAGLLVHLAGFHGKVTRGRPRSHCLATRIGVPR